MSTVNLDFDLVTFASSSSNNNNNLDEDQEYVAPSSPAPETPREKKRKKKKCGQTVHIPPNILELCVPEGTRSKLTNGQQVSYLSGVLNALGCNLDNFHMSHSSADRYTKKVKGKLAQKIRDNFQKSVKEKRARIVIHYDGKLVQELDMKKVKRKKKSFLWRNAYSKQWIVLEPTELLIYSTAKSAKPKLTLDLAEIFEIESTLSESPKLVLKNFQKDDIILQAKTRDEAECLRDELEWRVDACTRSYRNL